MSNRKVNAEEREFYRVVGENIERARRAACLSQVQLARAVTVHVSAVSRWETCGERPTVIELLGVARHTGASLDQLIEGTRDLAEVTRLARTMPLSVHIPLERPAGCRKAA